MTGNLQLYSSLKNEAPILYLSMAASERVKFFTQSIGGKNKEVILEALITGCSHFC